MDYPRNTSYFPIKWRETLLPVAVHIYKLNNIQILNTMHISKAALHPESIENFVHNINQNLEVLSKQLRLFKTSYVNTQGFILFFKYLINMIMASQDISLQRIQVYWTQTVQIYTDLYIITRARLEMNGLHASHSSNHKA